MRTAIQNKIVTVCKAGTFPEVTYDPTTKLATKSTSVFLVPSVVVNEIALSTSSSVRVNARTSDRGLQGWRFEAHLSFSKEVDTYLFLTHQLKAVSFTQDNTKVVIRTAGVAVDQPPRQSPHNGTQMVITFNVDTKA